MIKFADKAAIPYLKAIWREAFGDDEAYINFFYEHRFNETNTLVWLEEDKPVAMLTLLPAQMNIEGELQPVKYVYGVATKLEYRGRGISTALINAINKHAEENHERLVLVPAEDSLFEFYKKLGYRTSFYLKKLILNVKELQSSSLDYSITPITPNEYNAIRDKCFWADGYIVWGDSAMEYILSENAFMGGFAVKVTYRHSDDILMYYINNDILYVKETSLKKDILLPVLTDVALKHGCHTMNVRLPQGYEMDLPSFAFGMIYSKAGFEIQSAYFNLVSD